MSIAREANDDCSLQQSAGELVRPLTGCLSSPVLRGDIHGHAAGGKEAIKLRVQPAPARGNRYLIFTQTVS